MRRAVRASRRASAGRARDDDPDLRSAAGETSQPSEGDEGIGLGGADEVVARDAAGRMGREAHDAAVVADGQVRDGGPRRGRSRRGRRRRPPSRSQPLKANVFSIAPPADAPAAHLRRGGRGSRVIAHRRWSRAWHFCVQGSCSWCDRLRRPADERGEALDRPADASSRSARTAGRASASRRCPRAA